MSTRKYLRRKVRNIAHYRHWKPSKAVQQWRLILNAYPDFKGEKRQQKGSTQPILVYPIKREGAKIEA